VVSPDGVVPSRMVGVSATIFPCTIKSRSSLLAPTHPGGAGKRAVKRLWWCGGVVVVCVICVFSYRCMLVFLLYLVSFCLVV